MNSHLTSLTMAKLLCQKGDYKEARSLALEAMIQTLTVEDRGLWLEATRCFFQCCQELEQADQARDAIENVISYLRTNPPEELQAPAETLVASWLLAQGKVLESQDYIHSSIAKATQLRDLESLARALLVLAYTFSLNSSSYGQALQTLHKLEVILSEIANPEVLLSVATLRGFIYTQTGQFKEAVEVLWFAYEQAKLHGFYPHVSSILAQLARVYRDQKLDDQFKIYAELALKGTDATKMPRLYHLVSSVCPQGLDSLRPQYDFQVDEGARLVKEKTKGGIDFKNQHILYDLALLFIRNLGQRYSKEDLVELIWKQAYDPELHDNLIYVSIKRLRTLIEPDPESPKYILRDRKGYYLNPQTIIHFNRLEESTL